MLKKIIIFICFLFLLAIFWQLIETSMSNARMTRNETGLEAFIPTPLVIVQTFFTDGKTIFSETSYTLGRALVGFTIGLIAALFFVLLFEFFPLLRSPFMPFAFALNSFPIVGLAPAVILFFGQGSSQSIVFISALISYFPLFIKQFLIK